MSEENVKGWECPKCGKIYSPFMSECISCNVKKTYSENKNDNKEMLLTE